MGFGLISVLEKAQLDLFLELSLHRQWEPELEDKVAESNEEATAVFLGGRDWNAGRV